VVYSEIMPNLRGPPISTWATVLASGLLGIISAAITAAYRDRSEIKKIRTELRHAYERFLFEKRLAEYPAAYALLSSFLKALRYGTPNRATFEKFLDALDGWDSRWGWLFANRTSELAWSVQQYLHLVARSANGSIQTEWPLITKAIGDLESCLKAELGSFGTNVAGEYLQPKSLDALRRRMSQVNDLS
jgi:hypothetical protein